jgi:hypothetical protein
MKIGEIVNFQSENFFEGAVQLRWANDRPEQAKKAAEAFIFHGPRYHAASDAESDGIEGGYRLKDSASFVSDLLSSVHAGLEEKEVNPYWLVVAGYGAGKSHLALTCASLLGDPLCDISSNIVENINQVDADIANKVGTDLAKLNKPVLVLTLDGMAGFHLGNALSQAVLSQLRKYNIDTGAISALSPRFQTAEQFVERNFSFREGSFASRLNGKSQEEICSLLRNNDEAIYTEVDALYVEANGVPIPVQGQESAQELINTLCEVYCGLDGAFSSVVILFDEFGRYLEYAAERPLLAGDAALQQLFQGVQDNSNKVRFIGFIQYELKAYLKRFGSADLRQLQRYITRFDSAQKWYLSTNLETIFAHMIGKKQAELANVWAATKADGLAHKTWEIMSLSLPAYKNYPVWADAERFNRVISQGCWPLHPLATWFLTRQKDVVQSRSALTFIKETIERISSEPALVNGTLRSVSAAELILGGMLPEMIAAEHETGSVVAETLQLLLEKFSAHLTQEQRLVLAGVAILEKIRVGKQNQVNMDRLLCEATTLPQELLSKAVIGLSQDTGAIEWNTDLGQYELIADASTRGQFQQWLRKQQSKLTVDAIRDLFVRRGPADIGLTDINTDFSSKNDISTQEWRFEAQFAHSQIIEKIIQRAFQEWDQALTPTDAKGKVIYVYLHGDENIPDIDRVVNTIFKSELTKRKLTVAPIWVIGLLDEDDNLATHLGRLHLYSEQMSSDERERFRRFVPEETERSQIALKDNVNDALKRRLFWIAGYVDIPAGRIKSLAEAIFKSVYPKVMPFPFDGFASSSGGGAADCAQLTRSLIAQQVDGSWMQAQPKRLQNRASTILVKGWQVLNTKGNLIDPKESKVKVVFDWLQEIHQESPNRYLLTSYKALIAPPYGMNASSAGLLLGLMIGSASPPKRLESNKKLISSSDWVNRAFPVRQGKHFFDQLILEKTTLRFLSEGAESIWRNLLNKWESEVNYEEIIKLNQEADQLKRVDPIPEVLEGTYLYLRDRADKVILSLSEATSRLEQIELDMQRAERQNNVDQLLRAGRNLIKKRNDFEGAGYWPEKIIRDYELVAAEVRQMVLPTLGNWISRQSCNSAIQVSGFRHKMGMAVESLVLLGFAAEATALEGQVNHSIAQVEARQKFAMTLAESEDYPRQPLPTESLSVRDLRDAVTLGDNLINAVEAAHTVLNPHEISARVDAIKVYQSKVKVMLKRQTDQLGGFFGLLLEKEDDLHASLAKANRMRGIFVGTSDEVEVTDIIFQLEYILKDINGWECVDINPESLQDILLQQVQRQARELSELLETKEIDPAWDINAIYHALVKERVDSIRKKSSDWIEGREKLLSGIDSLALNECDVLEKDLMSPPAYLSTEHVLKIEKYQRVSHERVMKLREEVRHSTIKLWQLPFLELTDVDGMTKYGIEVLLKDLNNPPVELTSEEKNSLTSIEEVLTSSLDQKSVNEIISRIERLSVNAKTEIFDFLKKLLGL